MEIKTIQVGPLGTNCYIISKNDSCIVVDPGEDVEGIVKGIGRSNVEKIILTHLHFDHILAAKGLKFKMKSEVFCHKEDIGFIGENILGKNDIDGFLNEDHNGDFQVIHTPGHTPGSICLYFQKEGVLFSGDTIFKGNVGATHFKGGNLADLRESIKKKLLTLPDETIVYPGHGDSFRLGDYKEEIRACL